MTKNELKPIDTSKYKITETGQVLKTTKDACEIETSDEEKLAEEEIFNEWKSEQYKDQSTEEKMEFVEHLHTFPRYFKKAFLAGLKAARQEKWHDLKKYAKLLQDICTVMGGDIYMVSVGLENRVKVLWDASEEKEGLKMVKSIEDRLLEIKPQEWAEIEKW